MLVSNHLFTEKLPLLNQALDAYTLRQQTIARNIANATTPNYKPEVVSFEEEFQQVKGVSSKGDTTNNMHIPFGTQSSAEVKGTVKDASVPKPQVLFAGESHVNVDKEMSELAQNQIRFRFASKMTGKVFQGLQTAIRGTQS